jgi:hypothetical protein
VDLIGIQRIRYIVKRSSSHVFRSNKHCVQLIFDDYQEILFSTLVRTLAS